MGVTTSSNSAVTYTPIATQTLGSNQTSVTFNSLGSYTDIVVVCNVLATNTNCYVALRFNGDTGSHYSATAMDGTGSSAESWRTTNDTRIEISNHANSMSTTNPATVICNIQNYANTTTYKTAVCRFSAVNSGGETTATVGLWRGSTGSSTDAITSITIEGLGGTFATNSVFSIYGILAA